MGGFLEYMKTKLPLKENCYLDARLNVAGDAAPIFIDFSQAARCHRKSQVKR